MPSTASSALVGQEDLPTDFVAADDLAGVCTAVRLRARGMAGSCPSYRVLVSTCATSHGEFLYSQFF